MDRLKPSELRLLILFALTILGVVSFFGYDFYAKRAKEQVTQIDQLKAQHNMLLSMGARVDEHHKKVLWLNERQPVVLEDPAEELKAEKSLDEIVSDSAVKSAGLERLDVRAVEAKTEGFSRIFSRSVKVQGELEPIVQWLASLQSESSFRVVSKLRLTPPKKNEPEVLQCEATIEQWYATPAAVASSNPRVAAGEKRPEMPTGKGKEPSAEAPPTPGAPNPAALPAGGAVPVIHRPEGGTSTPPPSSVAPTNPSGRQPIVPAPVVLPPPTDAGNSPSNSSSNRPPIIPRGAVATPNSPGPITPGTANGSAPPPVVNQFGETVPGTPGAAPPITPSIPSRGALRETAPSGAPTTGTEQPRAVILPPGVSQ